VCGVQVAAEAVQVVGQPEPDVIPLDFAILGGSEIGAQAVQVIGEAQSDIAPLDFAVLGGGQIGAQAGVVGVCGVQFASRAV
jgi:hypothetical protein